MVDIKNLREAMDEMFDFICDLPSGTDGFECDFDAAFGELQKVESALRWIPVTERLPEKATEYLCRCVVYNMNDMPFYMVLRYILIDEEPHFQHEKTGGLKVTHWMPIPEPPKEVEDDLR